MPAHFNISSEDEDFEYFEVEDEEDIPDDCTEVDVHGLPLGRGEGTMEFPIDLRSEQDQDTDLPARDLPDYEETPSPRSPSVEKSIEDASRQEPAGAAGRPPRAMQGLGFCSSVLLETGVPSPGNRAGGPGGNVWASRPKKRPRTSGGNDTRWIIDDDRS